MYRSTIPAAMFGEAPEPRPRVATCRPSLLRQQRVMAEMLDALATHLDLALLVEGAENDPFNPPTPRSPAGGTSTPSC